MNSTNKNTVGAGPIYVLLPFYTEFSCNVFLDILKKIVSRTRLGDNEIESAFISGMGAGTLFRKPEDFSTKCTENSPVSKQVRFAKLLGIWAADNFPSLGKKLMGERWQPPNGRMANELIYENKQMQSIIQLRVIELRVECSTFEKVKHFVQVPASVCMGEAIQISKKLRMFAIDDRQIEDCWQALKSGKYTRNADTVVASTSEREPNINMTVRSDSGQSIFLFEKKN